MILYKTKYNFKPVCDSKLNRGNIKMLKFLMQKQEKSKSDYFNELYSKIKKIYSQKEISYNRKQQLYSLIEKYGYIPYSQTKAIEELSDSEVLICLEKKLEINKTYKDGKLNIIDDEISAVKRAGYNNADWIKQEQHDIKLINLSALGDGNINNYPAKFIDWLRQIVILPSGNLSKNIMSTTIYLVPFHPRDFGNAYLTASTEEVSKKLADPQIAELDITPKEQIKLFITLFIKL